MVSEEKFAGVLAEEADPEPACRRLVELANAAGGKDYITVALAHFEAA